VKLEQAQQFDIQQRMYKKGYKLHMCRVALQLLPFCKNKTLDREEYL